MRQWKVKPQIESSKKPIRLGAGDPNGDGIFLGNLAEAITGKVPQVWVNTGKEQVIAVVGKRGTGKSFTLGVLAEGLSCTAPESKIGLQTNRRAVLLFDPLDVYWTTRFSVSPAQHQEVSKHYQDAKAAGITDLDFEVEAWVPGDSYRRTTDPEWFKTFQLPVPSLGLDEWELLLEVDVMSQPMGQAFADLLILVRETGYSIGGENTPANTCYGLDELVNAIASDELAGYHVETRRALRQRLSSMNRTGLFSATGTKIGDLLAGGRITVLMLGRLPEGYRSAVVAVTTRMLISARSEASFIEKRLSLDPEVSADSRESLQETLDSAVPKAMVFLDEAQLFLAPGTKGPAADLFVRLVKEGRNMGLSAVLATQQPSAIDKRILSQVETFIAHQLVTEPDIRAVRDNLKSSIPDSIQFGPANLELSDLLRQLPPGMCFVSAADMSTTTRRAIVVSVRPRATVHGGIEL